MGTPLKMVNIPAAHIKLLNSDGYFNRFYELVAIYPTQKEAWEALENELDKSFNVYKYNTYESFKTGKSRYFKSLSQKY